MTETSFAGWTDDEAELVLSGMATLPRDDVDLAPTTAPRDIRERIFIVFYAIASTLSRIFRDSGAYGWDGAHWGISCVEVVYRGT
jgi:hypothetical protein